MKITEHTLRNLAADISAEPANFERSQRAWCGAFRVADEHPEVVSECALIQASFPACFPLKGWYSYFLERTDKLLRNPSVSDLDSRSFTELKNLRKRFAAFSGEFRCESGIKNGETQLLSKRALTIGVDVRPLSIPSSRKRGIGRYLINTLRELVKQAGAHKIVLFTDMSTIDDEMLSVFNSPCVTYRNIVPQCDFDLDIFLVTDPTPVLIGRRLSQVPVSSCPWMSIIYDFIPLEFPEIYLRGNNALIDEYLENIETIAQRAHAVFPISRYVADQCGSLLGMSSERIMPIFGGVEEQFYKTPKRSSEVKAKIDAPYFLYVGGADARKNITGLVAAFASSMERLPHNTKLVLAGEMTPEKTERLLAELKCENLRGRVIGIGGVSDETLIGLYANAIATVFVSHSEGLGLPALEAMATGCPVIASSTSALGETVKSAGLLVNPSSKEEIASAMIRLAQDDKLRADLIAAGKKHAILWRWDDVARNLLKGIEQFTAKTKWTVAPTRKLKVAMLNRENVWSAPGGDSKIMLQMQQAASIRDIDVSFPGALDQAHSADIVHFVNITLPTPLQTVSQWSTATSKPLVVTTLYEDWPRFLNASHQALSAYGAFLSGRIGRESLQNMLDKLYDEQPAPRVDVSKSLGAVDMLLACGESEASRLKSDFPFVEERVAILPFEVNAPLAAEQKTIASLRETLGFDEYVLCIGRLETRKNQLALLAALHDVDIPIVFAAGNYTPHPSYGQAVRSWKRKAPVQVLDRMPWHLMSVVMRAAAVHALPSFYELPGLVHLECAAAGVPVVAGEWGALSDYMPESLCYSCNPLDLESIHSAVLSALQKGSSPGSTEIALSYTQTRLADGLHHVYERTVTRPKRIAKSTIDTIQGSTKPKVFGGIHVPA